MSVELPNAHELTVVAGFAAVLPERVDGWELDWATIVSCAPRQEWLLVTFEPRPPYPADAGIERVELAMWRFSHAVHLVMADGAVSEDPIAPEDLRRG